MNLTLDDSADAILNSWIDADENKKDQPSEDTLEQEEDTSSENGDDEDQTEEEVESEETDLEEDEDVNEDSEEQESDDDKEEEVEEAKPVLTDETLVDIVVDGEKKQASVKDLKRLYGQEASLTRKSQETAQARKEAEEATQKAAVQYQKMLERAQERWKPYSEVDMLVASKQLSNDEFAQLRVEARAAEEDLKFLTEESNKFYQDLQEQQTTYMKQQAQECIKTLSQDIPEWSNEMYNDIRAFAVQNGLPSDQVDKIVDPNVIKIINKARMFDQTKVVAAKKKAKKAPVKVLRSKKSPPSRADDRANREKQALKKLETTYGQGNNLDEIADVFLNRWAD